MACVRCVGVEEAEEEEDDTDDGSDPGLDRNPSNCNRLLTGGVDVSYSLRSEGDTPKMDEGVDGVSGDAMLIGGERGEFFFLFALFFFMFLERDVTSFICFPV